MVYRTQTIRTSVYVAGFMELKLKIREHSDRKEQPHQETYVWFWFKRKVFMVEDLRLTGNRTLGKGEFISRQQAKGVMDGVSYAKKQMVCIERRRACDGP